MRSPVDGYVFTTSGGALLRRTNFRRRAFLPAVRASVSELMRFYDLRHSHVAALIAQGEYPKVIQTRLGYSSIKVTLDRYGHLFDGLDEAAAARLNEALIASLPDHSRNKMILKTVGRCLNRPTVGSTRMEDPVAVSRARRFAHRVPEHP